MFLGLERLIGRIGRSRLSFTSAVQQPRMSLFVTRQYGFSQCKISEKAYLLHEQGREQQSCQGDPRRDEAWQKVRVLLQLAPSSEQVGISFDRMGQVATDGVPEDTAYNPDQAIEGERYQ